MDKAVKIVKKFVPVKGITGVDEEGMILIELKDGSVVEADITDEDMKLFHFPADVISGRVVADGHVLVGFELSRFCGR